LFPELAEGNEGNVGFGNELFPELAEGNAGVGRTGILPVPQARSPRYVVSQTLKVARRSMKGA